MKIRLIIQFVFIFFSLIFFTSCSKYLGYGKGRVGSAYSYMHIPKADSLQGRFNANLTLNKDIEYYEGENNVSGELSVEYAGSFSQTFLYSAGINFFNGQYRVNALTGIFKNQNSNYSYSGGGGRLKMGLNIPISQNLHWRILNVQFGFFIERGPFFRVKNSWQKSPILDSLNDLGNFIRSSSTLLSDARNFSINLESEFVYELKNSMTTGAFAGVGNRNITGATSYFGGFFTYRKFVLSLVVQNIELGIDRDIINSFITDISPGNQTSYQLKLNYIF